MGIDVGTYTFGIIENIATVFWNDDNQHPTTWKRLTGESSSILGSWSTNPPSLPSEQHTRVIVIGLKEITMTDTVTSGGKTVTCKETAPIQITGNKITTLDIGH